MDYKQEEDKKWVIELIDGNEISFIHLFNKYHGTLYKHVLNFVKTPDLAKDLVQEIFIKIWENRKRLNPELSFKSYLYQSCRNGIINIYKRAAHENNIKKEIILSSITFHNRTEDNLTFLQYETIAYEAIEKLAPQRKEVFKLCRLEGKDYQEVADILGISKHTVRVHVQKATKFIKEYLRIQAKTVISLFGLMLLF